MPLRFPVCKWGQPFSLVCWQSGVSYSLISVLHTDKAVSLAQRQKRFYNGRMCFSVSNNGCLRLMIDDKADRLTVTWCFLWLDIADCESLHTEKGTTTIQCVRRLKQMYSIRRWYSELRLFPRQPEDVICLSDDCFGWQHPLSHPNFWQTYDSKCCYT